MTVRCLLVAVVRMARLQMKSKLTLSGLHDKRKLGVDAVGILLVLLGRGHCVGLAVVDPSLTEVIGN